MIHTYMKYTCRIVNNSIGHDNKKTIVVKSGVPEKSGHFDICPTCCRYQSQNMYKVKFKICIELFICISKSKSKTEQR